MKTTGKTGPRSLLLMTLLAPLLCFGADLHPIGRLFTTPGERDMLNDMRERHMRGIAEPDAQAAPPENKAITVDGIVRRSSGKSTAWINQQPQPEHERRERAPDPEKNARPLATTVRLPSGGAISLKPGQSFDSSTGKVRDAYQPDPEQVR